MDINDTVRAARHGKTAAAICWSLLVILFKICVCPIQWKSTCFMTLAPPQQEGANSSNYLCWSTWAWKLMFPKGQRLEVDIILNTLPSHSGKNSQQLLLFSFFKWKQLILSHNIFKENLERNPGKQKSSIETSDIIGRVYNSLPAT